MASDLRARLLALAVLFGCGLAGCKDDPPAGAAAKAPEEPARSPASAAAGPAWRTPSLCASVAALPGVKEVQRDGAWRQRPAGDLDLLEQADGASGTRRLRVRAPVERRHAADAASVRYGVIVDVLVDAEGYALRAVEVGEDDPELVALFGE